MERPVLGDGGGDQVHCHAIRHGGLGSRCMDGLGGDLWRRGVGGVELLEFWEVVVSLA